MTFVVTGATGHLGANLVRALVADGRSVRALATRPSKEPALAGVDVDYRPVDVRDLDALTAAFRGAEVVYHLAAVISITGSQGGKVREVNVRGTRNVVEAALRCGVRRLVHFSSVHAFKQQPLDEPLDEMRAPVGEEGCAYDHSKVLGQREILEGVKKGLNAVIVHPSAVLGPHDYRPSRMGRVLIRLQHRRLPAMVGGGFDWVDARDVASGAMAAQQRGRTGESYILSGRYASVEELVRLACGIARVRPPRLTCPQWLARLGAPFAEVTARLTRSEPLFTSEALAALRANRRTLRAKAARELGYQPRPLEVTLRDTYAWLAEQGFIAGRPHDGR